MAIYQAAKKKVVIISHCPFLKNDWNEISGFQFGSQQIFNSYYQRSYTVNKKIVKDQKELLMSHLSIFAALIIKTET